MHRFRPAVQLTLLCLLAGAVPARGDAPSLSGFGRVSTGSLDSAPSFLAGGFGKLTDGGRPDDVRASGGLAEARLAIEWEPTPGVRLFAHGVLRDDRSSAGARAGSGLLEAYLELRRGFGEGNEIVARTGEFFLPTSRENVGPLWTSPYTLTLSSLNSWIAEELRPIGVDLAWSRTFASEHRLALAATLLEGNDTAGTLLAWRGFALHDRPVPLGRFVPLPPLPALSTAFSSQTARGTQPFGRDLDGRPGWAGRARWDAPGQRFTIQTSIFRNEADRKLHRDQYAWRTDFRWLGIEAPLGASLRLLGEWGSGTSQMGFDLSNRRRSRVDIAYDTRYALLSWKRSALRLSLRYDQFRVEDRDRTPGDDNRENGDAWTFAALVDLGSSWRLGGELLGLRGERPAASALGSPALDARSFRIELRYSL
jgi:hypothetical protein